MLWLPATKYRLIRGEYVPVVLDYNGQEIKNVAWAPQPGSQVAFLAATEMEVLYEGTRGPGKTDALIMDFCQHVGQNFGAEWKGVLFRQTHPQLRDVVEKSKKWIKRIWPGAFYNEIKFFWEWESGERLYFSHFNSPSQYSDYHGHAYPWIGWEELTTWPNADCYKVMFSCSRSTIPGMPRKVRSTTNPYGVGHNWVKTRWRLPVPPGYIIGPRIIDSFDDQGNREPPRRAIHGHLDENQLLLHSDPEYKNRIRAAARNESELHAWLDGSWDIVAGGMFDDIWYAYRDAIVVQPFEVPPTWTITRAYDHGSSKPFSLGWYAESDGTDLVFPDGSVRATVRGDLFRVKEWYGWRGQPNEGSRMLVADIARGIVQREIEWGWRAEDGSKCRVKRGPADTQIFDENNGVCIATDFEKKVLYKGVHHHGIEWERADKGPGSREQGWEQMRKRMKATKRPPNGYREIPGLFISTDCVQWLRCVPVLPRDDVKLDDVNDEAEDHNGDETRYRLRYETRTIGTGRRQVV
jgi:hypothetical protein